MRKFIYFISVLIFFCCYKEKNPIYPSEDAVFAIYLLKDASMKITQILDTNIKELELANEPWLQANDIDFYDYSTHCIYLQNNKDKYFTTDAAIKLDDQPFIVCANYKRCYIGSFHSCASSLAPTTPYMDELDIMFYPKDVMHISKAWGDENDARINNEIENALKQLNIFHSGLSLVLNDVQVIDNSDTATVLYSFEIKNNDQDDIYVIDPEKMGSELFHYYTNGPHLWDYSKPLYLYSEYKKVNSPEPHDSWDFEWFTIIKSKKSIERTIHLKGYPKIPNGNYVGYMNFSNPKNITKDERYIGGSRIWIGTIKSSDIDIIIQN